MRATQRACLVENFEILPTQQGAVKRCIWNYHLVVEFWNSPFDLLAEASGVEKSLRLAIEEPHNRNEIRSISYQFQPFGVSAQVNTGQAHIYIHTWPERGYSAIDIIADSRDKAYQILEKLQEALLPEKICVAEVTRGLAQSEWGET
ncbi:MAG: S-adenosylmethionine decarboxylase [Caldimicrobium sp.]|nr:S-adenosylmethionine decarboxylase [Caldimicrobium sp.]MCX7872897.1 S-adenosylmethionine decarboxylase [Caldimicrobium sp.]MDW8094489.1 S-adenosylmethionine decarboxylase [Caldimicrobium sp.]